MTLQEFIDNPKHRSAWVLYEDINLYVRRGLHVLDGQTVDCFDFANMEAEESTRGSGNLWKAVELALSHRVVYFENVLSPKLRVSLEKRGWTLVSNPHADWQPPASFYKLCSSPTHKQEHSRLRIDGF